MDRLPSSDSDDLETSLHLHTPRHGSQDYLELQASSASRGGCPFTSDAMQSVLDCEDLAAAPFTLPISRVLVYLEACNVRHKL